MKTLTIREISIKENEIIEKSNHFMLKIIKDPSIYNGYENDVYVRTLPPNAGFKWEVIPFLDKPLQLVEIIIFDEDKGEVYKGFAHKKIILEGCGALEKYISNNIDEETNI